MAWEATDGFGGSNAAQKRTDRKLAQKLADEWESLEKLAGAKHLTESHCRKVIAEMYERTIGEPLHFRTAREFLTEWVESKKNETEQRAFLKYEQIVDDQLRERIEPGGRRDCCLCHNTDQCVL
jgi:hypothetical protein